MPSTPWLRGVVGADGMTWHWAWWMQGKTLYTEEQLGEADYADPLRLAGYIGTVRSELESRARPSTAGRCPSSPIPTPPPPVFN